MTKKSSTAGKEVPSKHRVSIPCNIFQEKLTEVSSAKITNTYKPGQIIFYEKNESTGMYCVISGSVKFYKTDDQGNQTIVGLAGPGDLLGYHSLFLSEPCQATAEVIDEARICFLDKQTFFKILEKHPNTAINIMSTLGKELQDAEDRLSSIAYKSIRQRLAKLFLDLKDKYGKDTSNGTLLNIRITRKEMAQLIGSTTESVIRLISDFKREGLIESKSHKIILTKLSELTKEAQLSQ